ncbi:DUF4928 family protein [Salisaeta longa]|uniref:DUF4928 family protein n=1 Tax=Salisaeta longa TaxID=503170 RepID=UPI0003B34656|nr:DUF4928 family protein [Salisaeta longa]
MNRKNVDNQLRLNFSGDEIEGAFADEREIEALRHFGSWCEAQKRHGELPVRSRVYAALITLDRLLKNYNLDRKAHTTSSGAQVKMQTPHNVSKILARFGETRPIPAEAGRTSSGSLHAAEELLEALRATRLDELGDEARNAVLTRMLEHLVWVAGEYAKCEWRKRARIAVEYDPTRNATQIIADALDKAESKAGAVAQHLVGAKLQLRLPDIEIPNHGYSTADVQTGRRGDFEINDSVFHVTVAPMDGHYQKCVKDLRAGYEVHLMVRDSMKGSIRQIAHETHDPNISVQSIEGFIGQNLNEIAAFSRDAFKKQFKALLDLYNERVAAVEADKSLLIDIPENLSN